ncbi:alpha-1,2-mannosidase subfamily [Pochonia chlamydosporia 170]|uniref:Alpha-1,2-mannosidase subfamily n=1 Tax=Pochonia chlamydosporia 170 TaxID=1380566 RepID=A0A179FAK0_METCM|nr:alpha-1,2-mannosidase subfamily [Pochonia chlamydosporia 170]OAQ62458.1 alpha-1,2-mannosidase subfamily [Pochonia chlamydosporia 170]
MHDSGTGGWASLGNFPLFPQSGCPDGDPLQCHFTKNDRGTNPKPKSVVAKPGYFTLSLDTAITADMTVSNHTTLFRFTFPEVLGGEKIPSQPLILLDLIDLRNSRSRANASVDASSGRIKASGGFGSSFSDENNGNYVLYTCADFAGAKVKDAGVFVNGKATFSKSINVGSFREDQTAGAFVQFKTPDHKNQIFARVGMSFISEDQACNNAENEIPTFDFNKTQSLAEDAWRKKMEVVNIDPIGVDKSLQTIFWSGIYRAMISPQDYTGENPLWKSDEPYYDSYYCIWDSFRSTHPLITLLDPLSQTRMVRSLIDIYRHEGKLPDCRMSLCKGYTQGGSNADVVLADAYIKGLNDNVDWTTGYKAVVSDAEDESANCAVEGRGGLRSWKELGYIPTDDLDPHCPRLHLSISRTVEYAYDDFCIAQIAKDMQKPDDARKYLKRSQNWKNLFNEDIKDRGFKGFLQPRYLNGTFGFQTPSLCSHPWEDSYCYLFDNIATYEGSAWLYTFYVPHEMDSLITKLGGPDEFVRRLQFLHDNDLLYYGDEQAFLSVYLFHYAGRPGLSSQYQHRYITTQYNDTVGGLPGNDDSGAMGSYGTLAMMGLWPMGGQDVYLINPPFFREVNVTNALTGKTATVRNINFDAGYMNIYIQNATLNGKLYTKSWITHDFYRNGGVLELTLGPNESGWGSQVENLPPSLSNNDDAD